MPLIRQYKNSDLTEIVDILNYYVETSPCIFQMEPYTLSGISDKFENIILAYPFYIVEENSKIIGFAYGSKWREKPAYVKSVETTIYIHPDYLNRGIGKPLYKKLIGSLINMNYHLLVAGMTLPNDASKKLHEKLGFEFVGSFKDAGMKFNQWHDVGFWQKII